MTVPPAAAGARPVNRLRVLAIPDGQIVDAEGRALGEDWLVADFGKAVIDKVEHRIYVTTDRVRASALTGDALADAQFMVDAANSKQAP